MELHTRILGEGKPLIILHGLFGSADNWQTHAKKLANYFQVILVDQRNHGHSDWSDEFSYDLMCEDLHEVYSKYNISKAIVIGHSMGGKTAMHFAQKYPEKIEKLIVVDMGIRAYPPHHQLILEGLNKINLTPESTRQGVELELSQFVQDNGTRQFLMKNLYWIEKGKLAWRMNFSVLQREMSEILKELPEIEVFIPTLFIRGELSNYIRDEDISSIENVFIDSSFITIENAGHWVHAEAPEEFIHAVLEYCLR